MGVTNFDEVNFNKMSTGSGASKSTVAAVQQAVINLTSAQILALFTTPITLVAAQGAGTFIDVLSITAKLVAGTQYTGANNLEFRYQNASGVKATADIAAAFINSATNRVDQVGGVIADTDFTTALNQPVVVDVPVANPAAGTGTMQFTVQYVVLTP